MLPILLSTALAAMAIPEGADDVGAEDGGALSEGSDAPTGPLRAALDIVLDLRDQAARNAADLAAPAATAGGPMAPLVTESLLAPMFERVGTNPALSF